MSQTFPQEPWSGRLTPPWSLDLPVAAVAYQNTAAGLASVTFPSPLVVESCMLPLWNAVPFVDHAM